MDYNGGSCLFGGLSEMLAGVLHLKMEQGATFTQRLTWKIDGSPVNLTSYSARMKVRRMVQEPAILSLTTSTGGGIVLGGVNGTIDITVSATQTALLNAGKYMYDLELVTAGGVVTRLVKGRLTIDAEITY